MGYIYTFTEDFAGLASPQRGHFAGGGNVFDFFYFFSFFLWGYRCSRYFLGILSVLGNLCAITNLGTLDILGILGGGLTLQSV